MNYQYPRNSTNRGSIEDYDIREQVGEGTYGHVFKAIHKPTRKFVALKRVLDLQEDDGVPYTSIREMKYLKQLQNVNHVVKLLDTFFTKEGELYLVFEWMEHDLSALISSLRNPLPLKTVKCYLRQILEGLYDIHSCQLMHRDIKAANLLLNNKGQIFIADFGLMTSTTRSVFSNNVITRWFKPPELLMGATNYGPEVDMWGVGCVLFELLTGKALFPGRDDHHQLELILTMCGTEAIHNAKSNPPDTLRNLASLPDFEKVLKDYPKSTPSRLRDAIRQYANHPEVLDLLQRLLCLTPHERITAHDALDHDFFWQGIQPSREEDVQSYPSLHEYEWKKRKMFEKGEAYDGGAPTRPSGTNLKNPTPWARPFSQRSVK